MVIGLEVQPDRDGVERLDYLSNSTAAAATTARSLAKQVILQGVEAATSPVGRAAIKVAAHAKAVSPVAFGLGVLASAADAYLHLGDLGIRTSMTGGEQSLYVVARVATGVVGNLAGQSLGSFGGQIAGSLCAEAAVACAPTLGLAGRLIFGTVGDIAATKAFDSTVDYQLAAHLSARRRSGRRPRRD